MMQALQLSLAFYVWRQILIIHPDPTTVDYEINTLPTLAEDERLFIELTRASSAITLALSRRICWSSTSASTNAP